MAWWRALGGRTRRGAAPLAGTWVWRGTGVAPERAELALRVQAIIARAALVGHDLAPHAVAEWAWPEGVPISAEEWGLLVSGDTAGLAPGVLERLELVLAVPQGTLTDSDPDLSDYLAAMLELETAQAAFRDAVKSEVFLSGHDGGPQDPEGLRMPAYADRAVHARSDASLIRGLTDLLWCPHEHWREADVGPLRSGAESVLQGASGPAGELRAPQGHQTGPAEGYIGVRDRVLDRALGERVQAELETRGWGPRRAAVLARIRPGRLARILAGRRAAGPAELGRLVQALGVDRARFERDVLVAAQALQNAHRSGGAGGRAGELFG